MITWLLGRIITAAFSVMLIFAVVPVIVTQCDAIVDEISGAPPAIPKPDPFQTSLASVFTPK